VARLICTALTSLDGYIADAHGNFDWAAPDPEVHAFVNDLERPIGTYLYGRRLYDTMVFWQDAEPDDEAGRDFAELWRAADKIVYSTTLTAPRSPRTRIEHGFDAYAIEKMKDVGDRDLSIGGPTLAAQAFSAGLVDEIRLFANPVAVGGGTPFLPSRTRLDLRLLDEHRFRSGVVYLRYATRR
jgi:dihydrofolate reductase